MFRVLGPLEVDDDRGLVDLKGPRHRAVLARLLIARGRVVPVSRLVDDLWVEAPGGAVSAVQTFVGALRKALEPGRPPRSPARLLVTAAPGYALSVGPEAVDAWRFEAGVGEAATLLAEGRAAEAREQLDQLLALWRGPAYAEFAAEGWARHEIARLDELRLFAVGRRAEATLALGRAPELVPDLEAHVATHPLHEDGWRMLALALYRSERQGDALATLRRARAVLREDLGVDPGPALRQLETDLLAQAPHLTGPPAAAQPRPGPILVGRDDELTELEALAAAVTASGRPRLALVSGAAGVGKTALTAALSDRLGAAGWTTASGASPELPGAPAAWPWSRIRERLGAAGDEPVENAPGDDPWAARFRRHRAIAAFLATASVRRPMLLVFDDLHWADEETLALVTALAADPEAGRVLIVGTYRSTDIPVGLGEALARAARAEPARAHLGGLTEPQVGELVRSATSREVDAAGVRKIHARSGGNPFFVRELARLLDAGATLESVPPNVRDTIRQRLAALEAGVQTHLRQASVLGQDVDLNVLLGLVGDEDAVLVSLDSALRAGLLVERSADRLRFVHALVQETLYDDLTRARRSRWHAATAEVIERRHPGDVEAITHHLLQAGSQAPATLAADYARLAAERAEQRSAPHEAARLWRATVSAIDRTDDGAVIDRLEAVMGLGRALAVLGDMEEARRVRGDAIAAAEALDDPSLTARVIGAFDVPAIWTTNDDVELSDRLVAAAERTLAALPADRVAERVRLLSTIAMERRADAGPRGGEAALEAEALARELDDPTLLAFALNARFMQSFHRAGLGLERAVIGRELVEVAARNGLATFEVLGHLILVQAHAARADFAAADGHAAAADALGARYDLPLVGVFTEWYAALRLAVSGDAAAAAAAYRRAAVRLSATGMAGLEEGMLALALLTLGEPQPDAEFGPYARWARPLEGAPIPDSPRDLLFQARTCLHATAAIEAGDRAAMQRLYDQLLPAADELAGAGSGLITLGPTAFYLARLSAALGRHEQVARHHREALAVAERAGAPHWSAAARDAVTAADAVE